MPVNTEGVKLTRSQIVVQNLPVNDNFVIEGGPGTGKTLLALFRAQKIKDLWHGHANPKILFMVYNAPLESYLSNSIKNVGLNNTDVSTYHSWLWQAFKSRGFDSYPKTAPFVPNWHEVKKEVLKWHEEGKIGYDHIILDEAQDIPIELIDLLNSISKNMTVFIDDEQSISRDVSTSAVDVVNLITDGSRGHKYAITENHRNYKEIIDLSLKFTSANLVPDESRKGGGRLPVLRFEPEYNFKQNIINYASENAEQTIGVLLTSNEQRDAYYNDFMNTQIDVQKYVSKSEEFKLKTKFSFDINSKGIKLLAAEVSKGLEFDVVFIPTTDSSFWSEEKRKVNLAMVSITRAIERLTLHAESKGSHTYFLKTLMANDNLIEVIKEEADVSDIPNASSDYLDDDIPF